MTSSASWPKSRRSARGRSYGMSRNPKRGLFNERSVLEDDAIDALLTDHDFRFAAGSQRQRKGGPRDRREDVKASPAVRGGLAERLQALDAGFGAAVQPMVEHAAIQVYGLS